MTHVAWRQSGLPPTNVIGAGCNLDSERVSHALDINLNTHKPAWVIGELSDNKGEPERIDYVFTRRPRVAFSVCSSITQLYYLIQPLPRLSSSHVTISVLFVLLWIVPTSPGMLRHLLIVYAVSILVSVTDTHDWARQCLCLAVAVMSNTGLSSSVKPEMASGSATTKPLLDRYWHELRRPRVKD